MSTSVNTEESSVNMDEGVALPEDFREWSCSDLTQWMTDTDKFKKEEISLMKGAEISGKSLPMVDRQVLKDIGITSVGRQLEIIQAFQEVIQPAGYLGS